MTTFIYALIIFLPALIIMTSAFVSMKKHFEGKSIKKSLKINLSAFVLTAVAVLTMTIGVSALEKDIPNEAKTSVSEEADAKRDISDGLGLLAAGLVTGLAGIGGGIAVAAGAPAAITATSEHPKEFGKSIIFVALGESIALYGVVISILILNKV